MKLSPLLFLFFGAFLSLDALGQTQSFYDSLDLAKSKLNQGQIKEALDLIEILEKNHSGDENLIRVKGQALYWTKDFDKTKSYFKNSIQSYPSLFWIKLDFGRILYELNEFPESKDVLEEFLKFQPDYPEAVQMMAEMNYWTGGQPKVSYGYLDKILEPYPENEPANNLKKEILLNTAPQIGVQSVFYSDTQIMQYFGFLASAEFYQSALIQPSFLSEFRTYESGETATIAQATLKSGFVRSGTAIYLRGGIANSSLWANQEFTYGVELRQKLLSNFDLSASLDREYYLYTLASLSQSINPLTFRSSFGKESGDGWIGKAIFQRSNFEDENWSQTIGAWFLIPLVNANKFHLSLGYSFNYSNSKEVRFSEDLPIINKVGNTEFETVIPGSYNPYFTPMNQLINAVLGKLELDLNQKISFSLTGNVGFYARIDNPNMVYYGAPPGQGQGNQPISQDDIYLILVDQKYTPFDFKASIDWKISPKSTLNTSYNYQETIFFNSHFLNLGLKIGLWNE